MLVTISEFLSKFIGVSKGGGGQGGPDPPFPGPPPPFHL